MKSISVEEACTTVSDCPHSTPKWTRSGHLVFRSNNIRHGRLDFSTRSYTTVDEFVARNRRATPTPGDLIITREAPMGEVALIPDGVHGCLGQRMVLLRPDPERMDARFMLYAMMSPRVQHEISTHEGTGSTVSNLRIPALKALRLPCPPLHEQRAIAGVLGALDDKIEVNRRMNETLEEMARGLFKSWFVDFDPVLANMAGRTAMSADAADGALFPDSLVDSVLGPIPRGWQVAPLGEVIELKRGYDLPTADRRPGEVPIVSSSGPSGYHDEAKVRGPGIVTGRYGTIGRVFLVWEDFWPLNTALYVRDFKGTEPLYVVHLLRTLDFEKFSDKGAVPGINRNHVHTEPVCKPPASVLRRFGERIHPWLSLVRSQELQSRTLAKVRDALLPRLLSGELRIRDAERQVGRLA